MSRLPGVKLLEIALIGFLGELDPENKRVPDPKAGSLPPPRAVPIEVDDRLVSMRVVKGTLQEALDKVFQNGGDPAAEADVNPSAGDTPTGNAAAATAEGNSTVTEGACAESPREVAAAPAISERPAGDDVAAPPEEPSPDAAHAGESAGGMVFTTPMVPPSICFVAHPQLHRYFTDFSPAVRWLIENNV